jgi:2-polyprenyl-3-methyl-5-hydroxy-6-metoxy-1,4-benzoquinol methylase
MSKVSFENYGRLAREVKDSTLASQRYPVQNEAIKRIVPDIVAKLTIGSKDRLLEIGCGVCVLLVPLSALVVEAVGVDHPDCVLRVRQGSPPVNLELVAGNFFDLKVEDICRHGRFNKILCYSVLHYLSDEDEVFRFIEKAVSLLAPGGRALFGDIPNVSRKERFLRSEEGARFEREWRRQVQDAAPNGSSNLVLDSDSALVKFDDALVLEVCRRLRDQGFEAYILPQSPDLPFGNTREDILIVKLR